jgi:ligand-binding SRPBCC domain-containing protein
MKHHVEFEQWVPVGIDRVFLFFANPNNLPRIMPPETGTHLIRLKLVPPASTTIKSTDIGDRHRLAGAGSEIVTSFRVLPFLPFRAEWVAVITEFKWNHHFVDTQTRGPRKSFHHRHELPSQTRNNTDGTSIRDVIDYEVGFSLLGDLAQKLFIDRQLRRTFAYRQKTLQVLLG